MISLLVALIIIAAVISVAIYIIRLIPLPAPFGNIAIAVVMVVALIWLTEVLTGGGLGLGLHGLR